MGEAAVKKLELSGVSKSFGNNHVLRGVDLSIDKGKSLESSSFFTAASPIYFPAKKNCVSR